MPKFKNITTTPLEQETRQTIHNHPIEYTSIAFLIIIGLLVLIPFTYYGVIQLLLDVGIKDPKQTFARFVIYTPLSLVFRGKK